jgi:methyl-accepting chemotaxis protein
MADGRFNLTIKSKVKLVFGSLFLVLMVIGLLAFSRLNQIGQAAGNIQSTILPTTQLLGKMTDQFQTYRILEAEHVLAVDQTAMDKIEADMTGAADSMKHLMSQIDPLLTTEQQRAYYGNFTDSWNDFLAAGSELNDASRKNEDEKAAKAYREHGGKAFGSPESLSLPSSYAALARSFSRRPYCARFSILTRQWIVCRIMI